MQVPLSIRSVLEDRKSIYDGLKARQSNINSPTFSCRDVTPRGFEDPQDAEHLGRLIRARREADIEINSERLFGNIELLKCGIRILNLQNEISLRRGERTDGIQAEILKMDFLMAFAKAVRERETIIGPYENKDEMALTSFFANAVERLDNVRMGIDVFDITELDDDSIQAELSQARQKFAAHTLGQISLSLTEVVSLQMITFQLERGVLKKFIPDSDDVRKEIQNYRVRSNRLITQTGQDLEALENFIDAIDAPFHGLSARKKEAIVPLPLPDKYSLAMPPDFMP